MQPVLSEQCLCFFASIILGFFLGLSYEGLRFFRTAIKHNRIFLSIEDFFFCIYCTFCLILLCYAYADGIIRWFVLFGSACGALVYFLTLGRFFVRCTDRFLRTVKLKIREFITIRLMPLWRFFTRCARHLKQTLKVLSDNLKKRKLRRADEKIRTRLEKNTTRTF